jgi:hypothetical protein
MNTKNENEKPAETRDARTTAPGVEPFEPEPAASPEASDFRETAEGGYGWGV